MRTAKRTGYQRPAKHKQGEKQDDRFLAMVCFQMALCILAAAVFLLPAAESRGKATPLCIRRRSCCAGSSRSG